MIHKHDLEEYNLKMYGRKFFQKVYFIRLCNERLMIVMFTATLAQTRMSTPTQAQTLEGVQFKVF